MKISKTSNIGVLLGGLSQEREISIKSGHAILKALQAKGYQAIPIDMGRNIASVLQNEKIEAAFLALHGRFGEDGSIQGLLEILQIPYTGSSVMSSSLAMDKFLSKDIARAAGLTVPQDYFFDAQYQSLDSFLQQVNGPFPLIVKPNREGSTIGISKVEQASQLKSAMEEAIRLDSRVLVEQFIQGREITVGLLNREALPVLEVVPKNGFYDFESKYTPGATEYLCPADLSDQLTERLQTEAKALSQRMACEGAVRVDFMIASDDEPYFLEINTLPGMTELSLVPKAAAVSGVSFEELVERILQSARLKAD